MAWNISAALILLCMLAAALGLYRLQHRPSILVLLSYVLSFFILASYSDMLPWYRYEQEQKQLQQAKDIFADKHKLAQLIRNLQTAVARNPKDAQAWFLLGRIAAGQNDWALAHDHFLKASQLLPKSEKYALFYIEAVLHVEGRMSDFAWDKLKQLAETPAVLMFKANDALQRHCPQEAVVYWRAIKAQVKDAQDLDELILKNQNINPNNCSTRP